MSSTLFIYDRFRAASEHLYGCHYEFGLPFGFSIGQHVADYSLNEHRRKVENEC